MKVEDKKNYLEAEKDTEGWEGLLCELGGSNVVLVLVLWPVTERERHVAHEGRNYVCENKGYTLTWVLVMEATLLASYI